MRSPDNAFAPARAEEPAHHASVYLFWRALRGLTVKAEDHFAYAVCVSTAAYGGAASEASHIYRINRHPVLKSLQPALEVQAQNHGAHTFLAFFLAGSVLTRSVIVRNTMEPEGPA